MIATNFNLKKIVLCYSPTKEGVSTEEVARRGMAGVEVEAKSFF